MTYDKWLKRQGVWWPWNEVHRVGRRIWQAGYKEGVRAAQQALRDMRKKGEQT